jgi:S1-C subfamily serine protease
MARTPELVSKAGSTSVTLDATRSRDIETWEGNKVRNIVGLDEVSAAGTPGETGVIVLDVPQANQGNAAVIAAGDVILAFNNKPVKDTQDLMRYTREAGKGTEASITILHYQQQFTVKVSIK